MSKSRASRHDALLIVLSVALVAGMAVAILLVALWQKQPAAMAKDSAFRAAVFLCPPFMLVRVVGGVDDTTLGLVITTGTIVMANGSLYAGLAAFVYWGFVTFRPPRKLL